MIAKARQLVFQFFYDRILKSRIRGDIRTGEHDFLKHHDAQAVAFFIEHVPLVDAAAPNAQHIEIRRGGSLQQAGIFPVGRCTRQPFERHPVGAPTKDRNVVDENSEVQTVGAERAFVQNDFPKGERAAVRVFPFQREGIFV